jgi:hypothetical protein
MPTARPYRHKDVSGPTCRRLQATHINLLSNLINPAEVCRHLFIMLQNPAGFRGRKIILLQAPAEAHLAVGAPRRPCLFSLSPCGPAATRRTGALVGGAAEDADARVRWSWQFAGVGRATRTGGRRILPGSGRRRKQGGRRRQPRRDLAHGELRTSAGGRSRPCDEIGEVADLGLNTN